MFYSCRHVELSYTKFHLNSQDPLNDGNGAPSVSQWLTTKTEVHVNESSHTKHYISLRWVYVLPSQNKPLPAIMSMVYTLHFRPYIFSRSHSFDAYTMTDNCRRTDLADWTERGLAGGNSSAYIQLDSDTIILIVALVATVAILTVLRATIVFIVFLTTL